MTFLKQQTLELENIAIQYSKQIDINITSTLEYIASYNKDTIVSRIKNIARNSKFFSMDIGTDLDSIEDSRMLLLVAKFYILFNKDDKFNISILTFLTKGHEPYRNFSLLLELIQKTMEDIAVLLKYKIFDVVSINENAGVEEGEFYVIVKPVFSMQSLENGESQINLLYSVYKYGHERLRHIDCKGIISKVGEAEPLIKQEIQQKIADGTF